MAKVIELRPNKRLLNSNFEKYQFCTDKIPVENEQKLTNEIFHLEANTSRESWLEARLFALHNHLFLNPFNSSCWFVDNTGAVYQFLNGNLEQIHTLKPVDKTQVCTKYNPSIGFANEKITVMSNGTKNLEIFIQEDTEKHSFIFDDIDSGIIMDVQQIKDTSFIIVSVYNVVEVEGKMHSRLTLLTYSYEREKSSCTLHRTQNLKVKGTIDYVYVEDNGTYFHTASQDPVVFEYDSLRPVSESSNKQSSSSAIKIPKYCWSQDEESVTVWLKIPETCSNVSAKIDVKPTQISVAMKDIILIHGETQHKLEPDLSTWKTKDDTLEIEFTKSENGLMWSELIKGDTGGEFLPNEALAAEIHSRLAHLCSEQPERVEQPALGFNAEQLEECDLEGRENILQRVNLNTHSTSNLSMLGSSNCILFTQKMKAGQMLCFRHDHDGCVWITKQSDDENWNLEHIWTFPAFGYVEASKTNKKFCISPSDASFIAIVEHTRHVFVYQNLDENAVVGKQFIIDFGKKTILGAAGINKYLIVLTKDTLYRLRIY